MNPASSHESSRVAEFVGRIPGRRSAAHGNGGCLDSGIPPGTPHASELAIVVDGRSYGTSPMIVRRGPQLLQC
ncbi:MAG TPA: hypothetical protein VMT32_16330 [Bryobacteraceae bacterium]|nr:hypothetical protein [Bryobacteraceae bacterium]